MHLIHYNTRRYPEGLYEINLDIVNDNGSAKNYTYKITSEFAVRKFDSIYRKGKKCHGKALALLNKFKLKENQNEEA